MNVIRIQLNEQVVIALAHYKSSGVDPQSGFWESTMKFAVLSESKELSNNLIVQAVESLLRQYAFDNLVVGDTRIPPTFSGWSIEYYVSEEDKGRFGENCIALLSVDYKIIRQTRMREMQITAKSHYKLTDV